MEFFNEPQESVNELIYRFSDHSNLQQALRDGLTITAEDDKN